MREIRPAALGTLPARQTDGPASTGGQTATHMAKWEKTGSTD